MSAANYQFGKQPAHKPGPVPRQKVNLSSGHSASGPVFSGGERKQTGKGKKARNTEELVKMKAEYKDLEFRIMCLEVEIGCMSDDDDEPEEDDY